MEELRVCGVLCDRKINVNIKGNVYRTVAQEDKLEVVEMRMLRCTCGVTKLDKIRNERIRRTSKVAEIVKKIQEWACDEKRGALRGKKGDGNESTIEKEERRTT